MYAVVLFIRNFLFTVEVCVCVCVGGGGAAIIYIILKVARTFFILNFTGIQNSSNTKLFRYTALTDHILQDYKVTIYVEHHIYLMIGPLWLIYVID
jgi:hypothetical protein